MVDERVHGGIRDEEMHALGIDPARIIDFSVSVNPYGPSASIRAAIDAAPIDRYPDPDARLARRALSEWLGVPAEGIVLGHGATELLWNLVRVLLQPGDCAVGVVPAFAELRVAVRAHEGHWRPHCAQGGAIEPQSIAEVVSRCSAKLVYVCAPSTPVGTAVSADTLRELAARIAPAVLVIDEAFLGLSERAQDLTAAMPPNTVRVRSLTKELGTPGVRVGYALAAPSTAAALEEMRPAWTVSAHAQAAALAYAREPRFAENIRARLLAERRHLEQVLARTCDVLPSSTVYSCASPPVSASEVRRRLLVGHGILVRDCASFGLPSLVRFGVRPLPDIERLGRALTELFG
jgi:histidinol-phosphate/aromatic aminotransferase/cobyric acid decarboxylase-like protein